MKTIIINHLLACSCVLALSVGTSALGQNLVLNGDFSNGNTDWGNNANGIDYYSVNGTPIVSFGWNNGVGIWQNTTATIQPDTDYTLSVTAAVGQSVNPGLDLSLQDVTLGYTIIQNEEFDFTTPEQGNPGPWETFSYTISAATLSSDVGDTLGVGINKVDPANSGWLWLDNVSLVANPVPEPSTLAFLSIGALGLLLRTVRKN